MTGLERLWAGWRSEYLTSSPDPAGDDAPPVDADRGTPATDGARCVFCRILASGEDDDDTHVLWRHPAGRVVALLNAFPYATGHLMVMPVRHTADLETLGADESPVLWQAVADAVQAVKAAFRPDGFNVGANLGEAAGAGVPGHLHIHVLPRWRGDSNFMTSVAEARVLPEALGVSAAKLREAWPPASA